MWAIKVSINICKNVKISVFSSHTVLLTNTSILKNSYEGQTNGHQIGKLDYSFPIVSNK